MFYFLTLRESSLPNNIVTTTGVQRNSRGRRTTHPARREVVSDPVYHKFGYPVITTKAGGAGCS